MQVGDSIIGPPFNSFVKVFYSNPKPMAAISATVYTVYV